MTGWVLLAALFLVFAAYLWERSRRRSHAVTEGLHSEIDLLHTATWELYHNDFSRCSKKVRVCLAELGIDCKSHPVDLVETGAYENISSRFLAVNPAATVPVLVHRGHPIYESHAQIRYAAAECGQPDALVPADDTARAVMDRWVYLTSLIGDDPIAGMRETAGNAVPGLTLRIFATMIEAIGIAKILEGLLFHRFKQRALFFLMLKLRGPSKLPRTKPLVRAIAGSRAAMAMHLDALEETLTESGGPWIVGAEFSLADVGMMAILDRLREGDWLETFLTDERPKVRNYWAALQARPSYRSAIAGFEHPTVVRGTARLIELKQSDPSFREALSG